MLLAVTLTAVSFAYDAGSGTRTTHRLRRDVCAELHLCLLAVRQSGIFTAVVQPPLILFVACPAPTSCSTVADSAASRTSRSMAVIRSSSDPVDVLRVSAVLLIRMGRWYYGMSSRRGAACRHRGRQGEDQRSASSVTSKVSSLLKGQPAESDEEAVDAEVAPPPARHRASDPGSQVRPRRQPHPQNGQARHAVAVTARPATGTEIVEAVASVPAGPVRPGRAEQPPYLPPSRVGARARPRRANPARPRRLPTGEAATSAPSDGAALMIIRRKNHTSATEMGRITRYRGCATAAVPRRATTARSTGAGRARHAAAGKPKAGSTTSNPERS